eukprot:SAG11_NODE_1764_length_4288_cov_3.044163_2_plen_841_part_00
MQILVGISIKHSGSDDVDTIPISTWDAILVTLFVVNVPVAFALCVVHKLLEARKLLSCSQSDNANKDTVLRRVYRMHTAGLAKDLEKSILEAYIERVRMHEVDTMVRRMEGRDIVRDGDRRSSGDVPSNAADQLLATDAMPVFWPLKKAGTDELTTDVVEFEKVIANPLPAFESKAPNGAETSKWSRNSLHAVSTVARFVRKASFKDATVASRLEEGVGRDGPIWPDDLQISLFNKPSVYTFLNHKGVAHFDELVMLRDDELAQLRDAVADSMPGELYADVTAILNEIDIEGKGRITHDDFKAWWLKHCSTAAAETEALLLHARQLFQQVEIHGHSVDTHDLEAIMIELAHSSPGQELYRSTHTAVVQIPDPHEGLTAADEWLRTVVKLPKLDVGHTLSVLDRVLAAVHAFKRLNTSGDGVLQPHEFDDLTDRNVSHVFTNTTFSRYWKLVARDQGLTAEGDTLKCAVESLAATQAEAIMHQGIELERCGELKPALQKLLDARGFFGSTKPELNTRIQAIKQLLVPESIIPTHWRSVALVVSIGNYLKCPLEHAVADGSALAEQLRALPGSIVLELHDHDHEMISREKMDEVIERFYTEVSADPANTIAIFCFFGHACHVEGQTFLLPQDIFSLGNLQLLSTSMHQHAISVQGTLQQISAVARAAWMIIDAAHETLDQSIGGGAVRAGCATLGLGERTMLMLSTKPGSVTTTQEFGGHSTLARAVLERVQRCVVSDCHTLQWLAKSVKAEVKQICRNKQDFGPWIGTNDCFDDVYLAGQSFDPHGGELGPDPFAKYTGGEKHMNYNCVVPSHHLTPCAGFEGSFASTDVFFVRCSARTDR